MTETAVKEDEKTRITSERVETIINNLELPAERLSELTDGLSVEAVDIIKDVERKGLRGPQHNR
jgi:hypothetical protein